MSHYDYLFYIYKLLIDYITDYCVHQKLTTRLPVKQFQC
jgi:hypothetical protein